jgi:hypothetical protein
MASVEEQIQNIFDKNKIEDLNDFIRQRSCLNTSTQYLTYLFYLLQATGVFLTSLGQAYQHPLLIWCGVGSNSLASFIYIIINSNAKINTTLMGNIRQIKLGGYIDEGVIDAFQEKKSTGVPATPGFKRSTTEI